LNSPSIADGVTIESSSADVPVEAMVKRHGSATYVFAVGMRDGSTQATFHVAELQGDAQVEVLGEARRVEVKDGTFRDEFRPWDVHLYRIADK
jgi:hypothetical protein